MSKRKFEPSITEMEDKVNDELIRTAKEDACMDWFINRLNHLNPEYGPDLCEFYNWAPDWKSFPIQQLEPVTNELQQNLDRLLPGYRKSDTPLLEDKKFNKKLGKRWQSGEVMTDLDETSHELDWVPQSLLDILLEKQNRERCEPAPPAAPEDTQTVFIESCRQLKDFIDGEQAAATFAFGGIVPIAATGTTQSKDSHVSAPVNVFWSTRNDSTAHKLVLPLDGTTQESSQEVLRKLVGDCDPASFGLGDENVIDPEYRKAVKINPDQFATSFHPADYGIIHDIEQVLLPSISSELDNKLQSRKIHAELYKLNVYSGPSGLFRKHVDTPRSENQVGSLVVCLPAPFKGGNLTVQHYGKQVEFDWSVQSASTIQWAAFYSDCEHEIKTITEGDRITLTYNLYATEARGVEIPPDVPIMDPKAFPLYEWMKNLLAGPGFMQEVRWIRLTRVGGVLGICCSHAYPHASELARVQLPRALKGADLVLYSVFRSLGIEVAILPVLKINGNFGTENPQLGIGVTEKESWYGRSRYEELRRYLETGKYYSINSPELIPSSTGAYGDIDRRWKLLMMTRQVKGMKELRKFAQENDLPMKPNSSYDTVGTVVGSRIWPYKTSDRGQEEAIHDVIRDEWPAYYLPGVTWITEPKHEEMAFSYIAYGNEATVGTQYSCVSMFAVIPPSSQRNIHH